MPTEAVLQEKQALVAALTEKLKNAQSGVIVSFQGISVADDTALRRSLREAGVEYSVVKNTMLSRAAEGAGYDDLKEVLEGSTALATSVEDPLAPCKILCEFAEKNEKFAVKSGFFEGKVVSVDTIEQLAKVPPRDSLLAMLAGSLNQTIAGLARAINAVAEQQGDGAAAPAEG